MILPLEVKHQIKAVFTDFDDTLTEDSYLHSKTLSAVEGLHQKGFRLVIVSGRPAGWADCLMRILPIDAMVFENGAGVMVRHGKQIKTERLAGDKNLSEEREILENIYAELKTRIPHLKLATDQPYRLYDYAIDFIEEPPPLTQKEIESVMAYLKAKEGITAKLSSIHINYWYGSHTKSDACIHLLKTWGKSHSLNRDNVLYCGDSPNDEPMFEFFPHSVGVANIRQFWDQLKCRPAYVTPSNGGTGFQELAKELLRG